MEARTAEQGQQSSVQLRALSIQEFSLIYGIGRTKIYEELKSGRLRARKVGKRTIIAESDAESWLHSLPEAR
jgi:excisionase family DNA binding protein